MATQQYPCRGYMPPFRIWGNLYFVGTEPASTHIIDTGDGLIMLDSGYRHTMYLVLHNMYSLGLDPMQLKYIVHTHGHIDHCGATSALVALTGAKTVLGEADRDYVNGTLDLSWATELGLDLETFEPDILVNDGDILSLGSTQLKALATPGHTPGTMSYAFDIEQDGKKLTAVLHGGAGLNSLEKEFLDRYGLSYQCREDYRASMERLKTVHADIYLGNHVPQNKTAEKYQALLAGNPDAFVDSNGLARFSDGCLQRLDAMLEAESRA